MTLVFTFGLIKMILECFLCIKPCEENIMAWPSLNDSHGNEDSNLSLIFSSYSEIAWIRDDVGILVFSLSPTRQKYWLLAGLEADLWSWIVLGHSLRQITRHVVLTMGLREESARQTVFQFFRYLVQEEILRISFNYG
jgi:hypothetical protein